MRMTVKGQVTIPVEVRRALGLRPGDEVNFARQGAEFVVRGPPTSNADMTAFDAALDRFIGSASDCEWTTDEILDMTRGPERRDPYPGEE